MGLPMKTRKKGPQGNRPGEGQGLMSGEMRIACFCKFDTICEMYRLALQDYAVVQNPPCGRMANRWLQIAGVLLRLMDAYRNA